jgi:hypothetical protein
MAGSPVLLHHAIFIHIDGASYRLEAHADLMPSTPLLMQRSCHHRSRNDTDDRQKNGKRFLDHLLPL